ncbi:MAG: adenylate/guanylate cyclase domain-containing protein, partial [archaeon]|nr:adenylate/guanylate cyclase domain-containing protein [archaeon]
EQFNAMVQEIRSQTETIQKQHDENERLLLNVLPTAIANRLKEGETQIADSFGKGVIHFPDGK